MRRPHPRFDSRRNAWITKAGGKLTTLAPGPKTQRSEAAAWEAFYRLMAEFGRPTEQAVLPMITVGDLADRYGIWMAREVDAGRLTPRTFRYYKQLAPKVS